MKALEQWMQRRFDERLTEPNSALGAAIIYMQKRWSELTCSSEWKGAPRQQYRRESVEEGDLAPEKRLVLSNPGWRPRR